MKKLILILIALALLLGAWSYWRLDGARGVSPKSAGACETINGVGSVEDMAFNYQTQMAYMSVYDSLGLLQGDNKGNGSIVALDMSQRQSSYMMSAMEGITDFRPAGISLLPSDSGLGRIYVVNKRATGQDTVEVFRIEPGNELVFDKSIKNPEFQGAVDIAVVGYDQFYLLKAASSLALFDRLTAMLGFSNKASVLYFDRGAATTVIANKALLSSVAVAKSTRTVYVGNSKARSIEQYQRDLLSGELSFQAELELESAPEQIQLDALGDLWVAGALKPMDYFRHLASKGSKLSPSEIVKINVENDLLINAEVKLSSLGFDQSATSMAVNLGEKVILGSVTARNIQLCPY